MRWADIYIITALGFAVLLFWAEFPATWWQP